MIDTHTHLYMDEFTSDAPGGDAEAVDRAVEAGVAHMILPAVDRESAEQIARLHRLRPERTFVALGLHPTEVEDDWETELDDISRILMPLNPVAVGETGMDLYWSDENKELQKKAFVAQILLAKQLHLPVIIHCREAVEECCECIEAARSGCEDSALPALVFHSFTGSPDDVKRIRRVCDPYFGINGVVTFKNARSLPDAVREIGLGRLLLETDSPFLAPVPKRGKRNESSFLPFVNDKVAEALGVTPREAEDATDRNAKIVFGL